MDDLIFDGFVLEEYEPDESAVDMMWTDYDYHVNTGELDDWFPNDEVLEIPIDVEVSVDNEDDEEAQDDDEVEYDVYEIRIEAHVGEEETGEDDYENVDP